jgi:hypothetical protein
MQIIIIGFKDEDVSKGVSLLLDKYPVGDVVVPLHGADLPLESIVEACLKHKRPIHFYLPDVGEDYSGLDGNEVTHASNPLKEVLRSVNPDDVLAIAWDDSIEAHMVLHSVEDYGLDVWNVRNGLEPIQIDHSDTDDLYAEMQDALSNFIEIFSLYLTESIMENMNKTIDSLMMEHDSHPDIDPFEE